MNVISTEEALIRTAYAKLSYADEVRILVEKLHHLGRGNWWTAPASVADEALASRLSFSLSNFQFGKINDVANRRLGDLSGSDTAIGGEVLTTAEDIWNYRSDSSPSEYVAYVEFKWRPSPRQTTLFADNWPISLALKVEQFEGKTYSEYAAYTVTVAFQGKSRTYNAMMLFRSDERGRPQVYSLDSVVDSTAVLFAEEHSFYPAAFVKSELSTVPFIRKWLYQDAQDCIAPKSDRDNNRDDVCCDPATGRCGVTRAVLSAAARYKGQAARLAAEQELVSLGKAAGRTKYPAEGESR